MQLECLFYAMIWLLDYRSCFHFFSSPSLAMMELGLLKHRNIKKQEKLFFTELMRKKKNPLLLPSEIFYCANFRDQVMIQMQILSYSKKLFIFSL